MFANRKRIILDRGPSWPDYDQAEPFMIRYYVLFRKRPKWFPFNILVHKILKEDRGDLHDHYWSYITIILKGGLLFNIVLICTGDVCVLKSKSLELLR